MFYTVYGWELHYCFIPQYKRIPDYEQVQGTGQFITKQICSMFPYLVFVLLMYREIVQDNLIPDVLLFKPFII
ncbi:hypothetical protein XELAEV_18016407mg [Xenopus laevis]|uniref:Uncharacterized protein n=1 Tax=Xenopus laevis TaxID=8355 RepID=A0A974DJX0_XENLA|nr:hypothetical protein XELAEV_18016407mg [Xenopus laevis]